MFLKNTDSSLEWGFEGKMSTRDWLVKSPGSCVFKPNSYDDLQVFLQTHDGPFSLAGGQYSSGGQTLVKQGTIISLARLVSQVKIIPQPNEEGEISYWVSGGATWKYVLSRLVPHGLVPWSMQSYHNFTVGGAISINAHGRNGRRISDGLLKLLIMTMDGQIYECGPGSELFEAVVGGYGLIGIILEAQFKADCNRMLECSITVTPNINPDEEITQELSTNPILYNSELSPSGLVHLSWHELSSCMNRDRCMRQEECSSCSKKYPRIQSSTPLSQMMTRIGECTLYVIPGTSSIYHSYNWNNLQGSRRYLSYEVGYDAQNLVPMFNWRLIQSLLQEYFIPKCQLKTFLDLFQTHLGNYPAIELLNLSIRSLQTRPSGYLDWLPPPSPNCKLHSLEKEFLACNEKRDCECNVAVVIYFGLKDLSFKGWTKFKTFTRHLVKTSLHLGGRWYLPYCPEFDREDLLLGYPRIRDWLEVKQKYDPGNKLRSMFGEYLFKLLF